MSNITPVTPVKTTQLWRVIVVMCAFQARNGIEKLLNWRQQSFHTSHLIRWANQSCDRRALDVVVPLIINGKGPRRISLLTEMGSNRRNWFVSQNLPKKQYGYCDASFLLVQYSSMGAFEVLSQSAGQDTRNTIFLVSASNQEDFYDNGRRPVTIDLSLLRKYCVHVHIRK